MKRSVQILITSTILCVLGIGLLQYFWLKNAYERESARLQAQIQDAVRTTAERIDELNIEKLLDESGIQETARVFVDNSYYLNQDNTENRNANFEVRVETITSLDSFKTITKKELFADHNLDSLLSSEEVQVIVKSEMDSNTFMHLEDRLGDFSEVLVQMIQEDSKAGMDKASRLSLINIDSVFHAEATSRKLPTDYQLTVSPKAQDNAYQSELFPNLSMGGAIWLNVRFRDENRAVYQALVMPLILTISLSLILLFTVFYGVRTFQRQKRIAAMKTDFMNNMTHELKTPLANIGLAVDSIRHVNQNAQMSKIEDLTQLIKRENQKMVGHVDRVLEYARLEDDQLQLHMEHFNPNSIIQEECDLAKLKLNGPQDLLNVQLVGSPILHADAFHFAGAVRNLLDNALKFSPANKRVIVESNMQNGEWTLVIMDHGKGMSKEELQQAFDRFYRAESSDHANTQGFGLGLSYVKEVVEKMGGSIRLTSAKGRGTTARVSFPSA